MYAAVFVIAGTYLPYLPVWLDWVGLSPGEIAVTVAVPMVVRIVATPAIAVMADRSGDHRRFLVLLAGAALATAMALGQCRGFWPVLGLCLLFAVANATLMPLTETVAMGGVKAAGLDYGRMRVWGSLSFIAASFCGGWALDRLGPAAAVWLLAGGAALTALAARALPRAAADTGAPAAAAAGRRRIGLADALALLRAPLFLVFLLAVGAVQGAHAAFYAFGTLHWAAQGLSSGWAGALWAIGVSVEIGLLAFSGALVRRVGAAELIALGAAASVLRWLAMGFDPPLPALAMLQALHGITFGASHVGAFYLITRTVPEAQAGTAQALYAAITGGIAMGGATLVSGPLYAAYGGRSYWAMAALAGFGLAASLALLRQRAGAPVAGAARGATPRR